MESRNSDSGDGVKMQPATTKLLSWSNTAVLTTPNIPTNFGNDTRANKNGNVRCDDKNGSFQYNANTSAGCTEKHSTSTGKVSTTDDSGEYTESTARPSLESSHSQNDIGIDDDDNYNPLPDDIPRFIFARTRSTAAQTISNQTKTAMMTLKTETIIPMRRSRLHCFLKNCFGKHYHSTTNKLHHNVITPCDDDSNHNNIENNVVECGIIIDDSENCSEMVGTTLVSL
jgi:hypothetical protein